MIYLRALLGIAFFCSVAWLLSSHKSRFPWRVVLFGLVLQLLLGLFILGTEVGQTVFRSAGEFVKRLIAMTAPGAELVFGPLAKFDSMAGVFGPENGFIFAFAGTGLVAIIFFSALMSILYHLGVMQVLIFAMAKVMSAMMACPVRSRWPWRPTCSSGRPRRPWSCGPT